VALTRGYEQLSQSTEDLLDRIAIAANTDQLSRLLHLGRERTAYLLDRQREAVRSAADLPEGLAGLADFAQTQTMRIEGAVNTRASALNLGRITPYTPPRNAEAESIVVRRKKIGTITLDDLGRDEREGFPGAGFWGVPVSALYWCDGRRNLAEVIRLTELEMGPQNFDFVGYFRFLERRGYVEFVR
jgi:hypothetical protein